MNPRPVGLRIGGCDKIVWAHPATRAREFALSPEWRNGRRSRLKICRDLVSWGFKSPLRHLSKRVPFVGIDVGLMQNTAQRPHRNFALAGDNCCIGRIAADPGKLDVAALLADLAKTGRFQTTSHFPIRKGFKAYGGSKCRASAS